MKTFSFIHDVLNPQRRAERVQQTMRLVTGLGWGMVTGLVLGLVLCWCVVKLTTAIQTKPLPSPVAQTPAVTAPLSVVAKASVRR